MLLLVGVVGTLLLIFLCGVCAGAARYCSGNVHPASSIHAMGGLYRTGIWRDRTIRSSFIHIVHQSIHRLRAVSITNDQRVQYVCVWIQLDPSQIPIKEVKDAAINYEGALPAPTLRSG